MAESSSDGEESRSSSRSQSRSEKRETPLKDSPGTDSLDPEQDELVGETPLDNRFNQEQLELLVSRKDEYRHAGMKQRKELAFKTGQMIASRMIASGVDMSERHRAALFEVCPHSSVYPFEIQMSDTLHPQNVKLWFAQRARSRKEPLQWTVHWSAREVFYKEQRDRVLQTQNRMYEDQTGTKAGEDTAGSGDLEDQPESLELPKDQVPQPFHFFQRALTAEWEALTSKERDEYEEKAILWRSLGPGEEERRS